MKSPTLITIAFQLSVIPVANLPSDPELNKVQIANPSVAALYEDALVYETGSAITSTGALTAYSGAKTGRSPLDKRIVKEEGSEKEVWWGPVNKPMSPQVRAIFFCCNPAFERSNGIQTRPSALHACMILSYLSLPTLFPDISVLGLANQQRKGGRLFEYPQSNLCC